MIAHLHLPMDAIDVAVTSIFAPVFGAGTSRRLLKFGSFDGIGYLPGASLSHAALTCSFTLDACG
jgi:hypothetical protein